MVLQIEVSLTVHIIRSARVVLHIATAALNLVDGIECQHLLPLITCNHIFPLGNLTVEDADGVRSRNALCHLLLQFEHLDILRRDHLVVQAVTVLVIAVNGDIVE